LKDLNSCLYKGSVTHHRHSPTEHRFSYQVFCACLDLDELEQLNALRFFSVNSFNLFSFSESQHGSGKGSLANFIRQLLIQRGYPNATHQIRLLCYPNILGYSFNPLSTYFCYDINGNLGVILYEVSNTFGSRHIYLFNTDSQANPTDKHNLGNHKQNAIEHHYCDKRMYVSPFMPMQTRYSFRTLAPSQHVAICIHQLANNLDGSTDKQQTPILEATFSGKFEFLNNASLLRVFIKYPLMTLKVICAIHWEALKLLRKKLTIQPRQLGKNNSISWQDKNGVSHYEKL
jgi:DUF1365 family protein